MVAVCIPGLAFCDGGVFPGPGASLRVGGFSEFVVFLYLFDSRQERRGMAGKKMYINFLQRSVPFVSKMTGQKRDKNVFAGSGLPTPGPLVCHVRGHTY